MSSAAGRGSPAMRRPRPHQPSALRLEQGGVGVVCGVMGRAALRRPRRKGPPMAGMDPSARLPAAIRSSGQFGYVWLLCGSVLGTIGAARRPLRMETATACPEESPYRCPAVFRSLRKHTKRSLTSPELPAWGRLSSSASPTPQRAPDRSVAPASTCSPSPKSQHCADLHRCRSAAPAACRCRLRARSLVWKAALAAAHGDHGAPALQRRHGAWDRLAASRSRHAAAAGLPTSRAGGGCRGARTPPAAAHPLDAPLALLHPQEALRDYVLADTGAQNQAESTVRLVVTHSNLRASFMDIRLDMHVSSSAWEQREGAGQQRKAATGGQPCTVC